MTAKMPMMIRRALIRMSPTKKTPTTKLLKKPKKKKAMESARACQRWLRRERRHDLGARLAHQLRYGNDLIAVRAQRLDQDRKRGDGGGTVASAVVQQDDGAAIPGRSSPCRRSVAKTLSVISCGVFRGCSSQSLVSILLPMMM